MSSDDYCLIVVEESSEKDWQAYVSKLISGGYDQSVMEFSDDNTNIYQASTSDGHAVMVSVDQEGTVTISIQAASD